jgi:hypothetical protein
MQHKSPAPRGLADFLRSGCLQWRLEHACAARFDRAIRPELIDISQCDLRCHGVGSSRGPLVELCRKTPLFAFQFPKGAVEIQLTAMVLLHHARKIGSGAACEKRGRFGGDDGNRNGGGFAAQLDAGFAHSDADTPSSTRKSAAASTISCH